MNGVDWSEEPPTEEGFYLYKNGFDRSPVFLGHIFAWRGNMDCICVASTDLTPPCNVDSDFFYGTVWQKLPTPSELAAQAARVAELEAKLKDWQQEAFLACAGVVPTPDRPSLRPLAPQSLVLLRSTLKAENAKLKAEVARLRDLVSRAVNHTHGWEPHQLRWSAVGMTFSLGSTSAAKLCLEFGLDPDEMYSTCPRCGRWDVYASGVDPSCEDCGNTHKALAEGEGGE